MPVLVRTISRAFLVTAVLVFFMAYPAYADISVSVTATVPSATPPEPVATSVTLRGIAYPGSTVTIQKDGITAVQVPADPQARFDVTVGSLDAGTYTFSVFSLDKDGLEGPVSRFTVTLTSGTTVTITGIFLGPTINADKTTVKLGDTITVFGTTSPSSEVSIYFSSTAETSYTVTANASGIWTKQFQANDLKQGTYTAKSKATDPDGSVSEFSREISFQVATSDRWTGILKADINGDGKVDLVDFSILLFYWNRQDPANPRADINGDGIVNIIDFSVMLYYWTGSK